MADDKDKKKDDTTETKGVVAQAVDRVKELGRREIIQNLGIIFALVLLGGGALGRFAAKMFGASERQISELAELGVGGVDKEFGTRLFGRGPNEETNYMGALIELFKSVDDPKAQLSSDNVQEFIGWLAEQDRYVQRQLLLVVAERFVDYLKLHVGEERTRQLISRGTKAGSTTTPTTSSAAAQSTVVVPICDPKETKEVLDAATKHATEILLMLAKQPEDLRPKILEIAGIKHKDRERGIGQPHQWVANLRKESEKRLEQTRKLYSSREV